MFESFTLLKFFDITKSVHGRKKLQKMIHILESCGHRFPFKYEYHFYGPYSAQLQEEVNSLVRQGYISEERYDDTYVYKITKQGEELKRRFEEGLGYSFVFDSTILEKLRERDSQYLELVSTYIFLLDSGYTFEAAEQKAIELKPHLVRFLPEAIAFAEEISNIH